MNHEVLYLVAIFVVGCIAITFRAIMFNLAGERFVARLRKQVCNKITKMLKIDNFSLTIVVFCHYQARNGIF